MLKIESFEAGSLRVRNDDSKEEKWYRGMVVVIFSGIAVT